MVGNEPQSLAGVRILEANATQWLRVDLLGIEDECERVVAYLPGASLCFAPGRSYETHASLARVTNNAPVRANLARRSKST